jgi:hypothetical protein
LIGFWRALNWSERGLSRKTRIQNSDHRTGGGVQFPININVGVKGISDGTCIAKGRLEGGRDVIPWHLKLEWLDYITSR